METFWKILRAALLAGAALCIFDDPPEGTKSLEALLMTKAVGIALGLTCIGLTSILRNRHGKTAGR